MSKEDKNKQMQTQAELAFADAESAGATEPVLSRHVEWKEEGQRVVGWLSQVKEIKSRQSEGGKYFQYMLNDGHEMITCVCGAQVDQILGDGKRIGELLEITYKGKSKLGHGRTMNTFTVRTAKGRTLES